MVTGRQLDGQCFAYSPTGESLAVAHPGGKVSVYDAGHGGLLFSAGGPAEPTDSASNATCLAWLSTKNGKATSGILVGTAEGEVKQYTSKEGKLKWSSPEVIEGGVSALFSSGNEIFAVGASGELVKLDVKSGAVVQKINVGKEAVTCIAVSPDSQHAVCGGSSLSMWDLPTSSSMGKYTGQKNTANAAAFSPDGSFVVSAAEGEKVVCIWAAFKTPRKKASPVVATLSLEDPAVQLDTSQAERSADSDASASGAFHVAAVSEVGEAYVWLCSPSKDGKLEGHLLARILVGKGSRKGAAAGGEERILSAKLQAGPKGPVLLVARGHGEKLSFETVNIGSSSKSEQVITLQAQKGCALLSSQKLDEAVANGGGKKRPALPEDDVEEKADEDKVEDDKMELPEDELPLGERVAALDSTTADVGSSGNAEEAQPEGSSKTDSLAVLLTQAIRSNDRSLLERCISTSNAVIISNTVSRISPIDAALFLKAAVDRVLSKPTRAVQLNAWIKAVMHSHTGYLMTAPGVQASLMSLYQAIEGRVMANSQLQKIRGRLGLITTHSSALKQSDPASGASDEGGLADGRPEPELVFYDEVDGENEPTSSQEEDGDEDDEDEELEGESEDGGEDEDEEDDEDDDMDDGFLDDDL